MQRSINGGFGYSQAPGGGQIVPYDHWQPFDPGMITRGFGDQASEARLQEQLLALQQSVANQERITRLNNETKRLLDLEQSVANQEKIARLKNTLTVVMAMSLLTSAVTVTGWIFERRARKQGR
jgi:hypothetical protein